MRTRMMIPALLLSLTACGPTEEEKKQAAVTVYTANESLINAKREAMLAAFERAESLTGPEKATPFDLKERPPMDITTYPRNSVVAASKEDVASVFLAVESLKGDFEIHRNDSIDDVTQNAENTIKEINRIRYLAAIETVELKEPVFTGIDAWKKRGITLGFLAGEAKAGVYVFDLTDGEYLGSSSIEAQNSPQLKLRPTDFEEQAKFDLRQRIKEAAVTNLQYWDEVNRKK